jgi:acetyltransferase-like isoleucine patch superfamily enzyme
MHIMDIARTAAEKASHDLSEYLQQIGSPHERPFAEATEGIIKGGRFGPGCRLSLGDGAQKTLETGAGRITIQSMRPDAEIDNLRVFVDGFTGHIQILCGSSGTIVLGKLGLVRLDIRIGHNGVVLIGDGTTVNGAKLVAVNSHILVGQDGLWSDDVLIQGFDQHGIVDLASREIINLERKDVIIGRHVWVGRRSTVMPGANIGEGSIIGAAAVVTKTVPSCSAVAGSPGRVVRDNVTWSRPWTHLDPESAIFIDRKARELRFTSDNDLDS